MIGTLPLMMGAAMTMYQAYRRATKVKPSLVIVLDGKTRVHHHDGFGALIYRDRDPER